MLQTYGENKLGRDFCVGDIHGCYDRLIAFMKNLDFDFKKDRLFSVGDLVDRGPNSDQVMLWLEQPWFHAVRGNHDQMIIDSVDPYNTSAAGNLLANGGAWFLALNYKDQNEVAFAMEALPIMIEVETKNGKFGIVHANVPYEDWDKFKENRHDPGAQNFAMWDRKRHYNQDRKRVEGIDWVVVGHNVVSDSEILGNVINLDTGAVYTGKYTTQKKGFTILNMTNFEFYEEFP